MARYSWHDHYAPLRRALETIAAHLRQAGWQARVLADDNALVDRAAAHRAGIGWYGKNANLLLPGLGSWFVLGAVVTDAPLPAAEEVQADGCGSCVRCIPACPTAAIVAPGVIDARRCLAWLLEAPGIFPIEHRAALGDRIYGCDECQEVCPPNRTAARHHPPPPADPGDEPWVPLLEVLAATDDELLERFGRWYVPRRQPRYIRRNALIALGNSGRDDSRNVDSQNGDSRNVDPRNVDPRVGAALAAALADPDPMVRAHAVWAAARLGRSDLLPADDPDSDVTIELAAALGPQVGATRGGHMLGPDVGVKG